MDTYLLIDGAKIVAITSLAPLCVIGIVSLIWSVFQSTTQIQEQTIGYLLKIIIFGVILFFFGGLAWNMLVEFTEDSLVSSLEFDADL
jgi:type III secretory pathway component EscS